MFLIPLIVLSFFRVCLGLECSMNNSHYERCPPDLQFTCTRPIYNSFNKKMCLGSCVCNNEYLFDEYVSKCVPEQFCYRSEKVCGKNATFTRCMKCSIPETCDNYGKIRPKIVCKECRVGCECNKGLVYDTRKRRCVLPDECSCPEGMMFTPCDWGSVNKECGCNCRGVSKLDLENNKYVCVE